MAEGEEEPARVGPETEALQRRFIANDPAAVTQVLKSLEEPLHAAALKLFGHTRERPASMREVGIRVHQTISLVWEKRESIDPTRPILAYAKGILRRLVLRYFNSPEAKRWVYDPALNPTPREDPGAPRLERPAELAAPTPEASAMREQEVALARELAEGLSEEQRRALELQQQGHKVPKIAEEMGATPRNVTTWLKTGMDKIRRAALRLRRGNREVALTWDDVAPLPPLPRPQPKLKLGEHQEVKRHGTADRRADRTPRQAPAEDADPPGEGPPGDPPPDPGKKGGVE